MAEVFSVECERYVPNRFDLVHVLAARVRALNRGAAPRLPRRSSTIELAMREVASGAFSPEELHDALLSLPPDGTPETVEFDEQELLEGMAKSLPSKPLRLGEAGRREETKWMEN